MRIEQDIEELEPLDPIQSEDRMTVGNLTKDLHPGTAISFKGSRSYQTAFSRFSTGHLRCMNFESGKRSFPICPKCNISQFSPQHILQCLRFSREEAVASPLLFLDFVQIYGLMDLV
ncbi:uncharacterized protein TNCV_3785841 [Trichonephila clavipes]|nr:uncharacterized protein TNCV_3785841 [Trichonephila clavipes]